MYMVFWATLKDAFVLLTFMERTYAKLSMKIVFGRLIQNCHKKFREAN